jgi:hypothetical protein
MQMSNDVIGPGRHGEWRPWIISEAAVDGRVFQTAVRDVDPAQGMLNGYSCDGEFASYGRGQWFDDREIAMTAAQRRLQEAFDAATADAHLLGQITIHEYLPTRETA